MKALRILGSITLLYIIFVMVMNILMAFGIIDGYQNDSTDGVGFLFTITLLCVIGIYLLNKGILFSKTGFNESNNWTREHLRKLRRKGK